MLWSWTSSCLLLLLISPRPSSPTAQDDAALGGAFKPSRAHVFAGPRRASGNKNRKELAKHDALVFIVTGELTASQNGGGEPRAAAEQGQGVLVAPPANKAISIFPASAGEDASVQRCKRVAGTPSLSLIVSTLGLNARMDNPQSLVYVDLRTTAATETCIRP